MAIDPLPRSDPPAEPTEAEYRAFCETVMATGRGRWFLAEYARRHRKATAQDALDALARIEGRLRGSQFVDTAHVFEELRSLAATVRHARLDIGWSDSEFSKGVKVMALLELLENRIVGLLDDNANESVALPPPEDRAEAARVQLTVVSANPAPVRGRAELPAVDIIADATIVALPTPVGPPAKPAEDPAEIRVSVAAESPLPSLAFPRLALFEPFETEQPGAENVAIPVPLPDDFTAEARNSDGISSDDIVPLFFASPVAAPTEAAIATAPEASNNFTHVAIKAQHPPGYDPIAPVRALSEYERIALVS